MVFKDQNVLRNHGPVPPKSVNLEFGHLRHWQLLDQDLKTHIQVRYFNLYTKIYNLIFCGPHNHQDRTIADVLDAWQLIQYQKR
jgi:hypothetical protein